MLESPEAFAARVRAETDAAGRLPLPAQAMWEIFPFEPASLRVKPLEAPVLPEPARAGEGDRPCRRCEDPDRHVVWSDGRWTLSGLPEPAGLLFAAVLEPRAHVDLGDLDEEDAAELGRLVVRLDRAVRRLPAVARAHVNRWGDGGSHLHVVVLGRPAGLLQLRGSNLALWEEMLPRLPADLAQQGLRVVARALAEASGTPRV